MNNIINGFPTIEISNDFTQRDAICHSLIEGTAFGTYSFNYLVSILNNLKKYHDINGEDFVIDCLFMKYLRALKKKANYNTRNELNTLAKQFTKKEINSQYHIAFVYLFNQDYQNQVKDILIRIYHGNQNNKNAIKGIIISRTILFYLFDKKFSFSNAVNPVYKHKILNSINKQNFVEKYENIMSNLNDFYSIGFWTDVVIYKLIKEYSIDVKDNVYLFNATVCLMYLNPLVKIVLDIKNFKFPEIIDEEINHLMRYQIPLKNLLEMKSSIEIKNLCNLVYLLVLNQTPIDELIDFKDSMSKYSLIILFHVYTNYTNEQITIDIINFFTNQIDFREKNDFIFFKMIFMFKTSIKNILQIQNEIMYIIPKCIIINNLENGIDISKPYYGLIKRKIMKGDTNRNNKENIMKTYKNDFIRFVNQALPLFSNEMNFRMYLAYIVDYTNYSTVYELFLKSINAESYNNAYELLINIENVSKIDEYLSKDFSKIKTFLKRINPEKAIEIISKYNYQEKFDINEKINFYFNIYMSECYLNVSRSNVLNDSIKCFNENCMKNKRIKIKFINESGTDAGGISREWYTIVSETIIKSKAFISVPNGTTLTINPNNCNTQILKFTGQLIGSAFINKSFINMKLASFIWKKLLEEEITLDDMKEYDNEIYQSLKWISENDPKPLMATFVDMNDEELIEGGKNIEVNEENKKQYIKLLVDKILIKNNHKLFEEIIQGFNEVVDITKIKIFSFKDVRNMINGSDKIDIFDWKNNSEYNNVKYYAMFFEVIEKWPQEKLRKLLKFVTGSSLAPINGFKQYGSLGGKFKINSISTKSENLPVSHTCYNQIDIPQYDSKKKLENKLTIAIESEEFGFS